eukprot:GHVT01005207.1.p1 GENE.GHVT01005207.1~~GHVT01005207.1.p1  ORF type:complete len:126 (+),score=7.08 GHVT01005207.1:965-1342(+)
MLEIFHVCFCCLHRALDHMDWNAPDSVKDFSFDPVNRKLRIEALVEASIHLGNLEMEDFTGKEETAIELCEKLELINIDINQIKAQHAFLNPDVVKVALAQWKKKKKLANTAIRHYYRLKCKRMC